MGGVAGGIDREELESRFKTVEGDRAAEAVGVVAAAVAAGGRPRPCVVQAYVLS